MKLFRKILGAALCGTILLTTVTACTKQADPTSSSTVSGRYIQTDITPSTENDNYTLLQNTDGSLAVYNSSLSKKFDSTDLGETWKESAGPGTNPNLKNIYGVSADENGNLYGILGSVDDSTQNQFVKINADGSTAPVEIPALTEAFEDQSSTVYANYFQVLPGNKAIISFSSYANTGSSEEPIAEEPAAEDPTVDGTHAESAGASLTTQDTGEDGSTSYTDFGKTVSGLFDLTTGEELLDIGANIPDWSQSKVYYKDDTAYFSTQNNTLIPVTLSTATVGSSISVSSGGLYDYGTSYNFSKDGTIYSASANAVGKTVNDKYESIISNTAPFSFGSQNNYIQNFLVFDNDTFVMNVQQMTNSKIYKYVYDPNATVDPNKTLSVWSLYDDFGIRSIISEFAQSNPDATVTYTYGASEENEYNTVDAINALNTALLAGKGPDIISLDGLDAESYAEKGTLLDLKGKVDTSKVFPEIMSGFEKDGKLFYLPTRFTAPVLMGDNGKLDTVSTLTDLASSIKNGPDAVASSDPSQLTAIPENERPILSLNSFYDLINFSWPSAEPSILKDNAFDKDALRTYLTNIKTISDKYNLATNETVNQGEDGTTTIISGGMDSATAYSSEQSVYGATDLSSIMSLADVANRPNTTYISFPDSSNGTWKPLYNLGISSTTKQTDLATSFINTALSKTSQSISSYGLPVTQEGIDTQLALINKTYKEYGLDEISFDASAITKLLKTPVSEDYTVSYKIMEAARNYCDGSLDLGQTINKIEQDFRSYLAERG